MAKNSNDTPFWLHLLNTEVDGNKSGIIWTLSGAVAIYNFGEEMATKLPESKSRVHYTKSFEEAQKLAKIFNSIKPVRRPNDINQLAKAVAMLADMDDVAPEELTEKEIAAHLGGIARKNKISKEKRSQIAKKGANKRWGND